MSRSWMDRSSRSGGRSPAMTLWVVWGWNMIEGANLFLSSYGDWKSTVLSDHWVNIATRRVSKPPPKSYSSHQTTVTKVVCLCQIMVTFKMLNMHLKALKFTKVIFHGHNYFFPFIPATMDGSTDVYQLLNNIWIVFVSMLCIWP